MVKICVVKSCLSRRKNKTTIKDVSSLSFFQPTSQIRLETWSQSLGMKLKPSDFICQLHFHKDDIKYNYKVVEGKDYECHYLKKKNLARDALPTIEHQEQHYPVKPDEIEDEEKQLAKKRKCVAKDKPIITRPIAYLKKNLSALPQHWSYVEKPNEIEFIRIDPVTKKIKNNLVLKDDFTIMVIGSNNKKIYLDEHISSPNEIFEYLKHVEEWTPCVGTRLQKQKYSKQCKGVTFVDETSGRNNMYPRCKPCKMLRCQLRNYIKTSNIKQEKTVDKEISSQTVLKKQEFSGMEKPIIKEDYKTENFKKFVQSQTMIDVDVDLDNIASVRQKLKTLWSSSQFCGLCYYNGDCCPINTELVINRQKYSKCLRDIVNYVFNNDAGNLMASPYICDHCVEKSIQAYVFIHNTRQMSLIINNAVTDLHYKINDVSEQLSPSINKNDANVMIVLENDTQTFKSVINTKINEITPTSKPIPMTTDTYNKDTEMDSTINENKKEFLTNEHNENNEITIKDEKIKKENSKIQIIVKDDYEEIDAEMSDYDISDTSVSIQNGYTKNKITKFFPIAMPTAIKRTPKINPYQVKKFPTGYITVMKEYAKDKPKVNTIFNVKSKTMLEDSRNINRKERVGKIQ